MANTRRTASAVSTNGIRNGANAIRTDEAASKLKTPSINLVG